MVLRHKFKFEHQRVIGQRPNPLNASWGEWALVVCEKCNKLKELQTHSVEQMHGGCLEAVAEVTNDYLHHIYGLSPADVKNILEGKMKIRLYNRYKKEYEETYA